MEDYTDSDITEEFLFYTLYRTKPVFYKIINKVDPAKNHTNLLTQKF